MLDAMRWRQSADLHGVVLLPGERDFGPASVSL
jgi:hypothetical protein